MRRSIPIEDLFFFFREHPEFGTKISVFSQLRPANSNNFEKWPTRVQKLDHPDVSDDRRASAIAQYILGILQKFNCVEKLVAKTNDGASVMLSELNGVQAKIKKNVPEAMFLHCYAHKLNLVLLHSAKCMSECKAFFKTLEGLSALFNTSTKRTYLLDNVVKRRLPRTSPTRWSSNSRLLQTVSMYHSDLLMVFRVIGDAEDKWDNDSVMKAAGFERWLLKTNTCFLIIAYEEIF